MERAAWTSIVGFGLATALAGCGRGPGFAAGYDDEPSPDPTTETDAPSEPAPVIPPPPVNCDVEPSRCQVRVGLGRAVDILFIVDNSGSMADEQGVLARNFPAFIEVLERQGLGTDYRIAVTTTEPGTGLRATSCRSRTFEFTSDSRLDNRTEAQAGCFDVCAYEELTFDVPWIERRGDRTNVPAPATVADAFRCVGPQGINGSGFEMPLEAMKQTLEAEAGRFLRDDALLGIVFLTDEGDCSASDENLDWIASGPNVFWTTSERATSAVCWTAGVTCFGGPGRYDDCVPADKDRSGGRATSPDAAVLYPVSRYVDALRRLSEQKIAAGGQGEVVVAVIGGVPLDYPQTGRALYEDSTFPMFNVEYGIGPGCNRGAEDVAAPPGLPPVRLLRLAAEFATGRIPNVHSICAPDYSAALGSIAEAIGRLDERACVGGCARDREPVVPGLQPDCDVVEEVIAPGGVVERRLEPCVASRGYDFPSPGTDVCFITRSDARGLTPDREDDLSRQCTTRGSNVEYVLRRRPGAQPARGSAISVRCRLARAPGLACDG